MAFPNSTSAPPDATTVAAPVNDRYLLGPRIGTGSTGDVHRAWDRAARRRVAVKIFHDRAPASVANRSGRECARLVGIHDDGLVDVLDWGHWSGRRFLVMELVEGETLAERLDRGALPTRRGIAVGRRLARALHELHDGGVVHRDVKPGNVLLDAAGAAFLADFGIARVVGSAPETKTGEIVGTAAYMAPEQVRGRSVGPPADVYALGLLLLESLTGRREFEGGVVESAVARLHRPPRIPTSVPGRLRPLIARMTTMEPTARPDASAVEAALAVAQLSPSM